MSQSYLEIELTRVRRMVKDAAENAECGLLVYLLDMAILEVKSKQQCAGQNLRARLKVVR